jgi:hypothetical protein
MENSNLMEKAPSKTMALYVDDEGRDGWEDGWQCDDDDALREMGAAPTVGRYVRYAGSWELG